MIDMKMLFQKFIPNVVMLAMATLVASAVQNSSAQTEPGAPDASAVSPAAMPSDILPDSPLAQIIRLAQAGVDESIMMAYVTNSGSAFNLTSDQIIYLKDLGLPNEVVTAMIQRDQQLGATTKATPAPPVPAPEAPPQTEAPVPPVQVTQNYFYDTLSPYGGWVNVEGYGLCWRPTVVVYNSNWQPYCDHGHWIYTDDGWYWLSDYSWGACTFHYGRWFHDARHGWCWWPETTWAPSWVCWRYSNDYCGWAPLPPRTIFREGSGIVFNGAAVRAGFDFGISVNFFTFVPTRNFCDPHPNRFRVHRDQATVVFQQTTVINNFNVDNRNHTVRNSGIAPERISAVSKTRIERVTIHEATSAGGRGEQFSHNSLVVSRPHFNPDSVSTLHQGVAPRPISTGRPNKMNEPNKMSTPNTPRPLIINGNGNNSATHNNNISPPSVNQNLHPDRNGFAHPQPKVGQPETPRIVTPPLPQVPEQLPEHHSIAPAPVETSAPTLNPYSPPHSQPLVPSHDRDNDKQLMSPKGWQSQQPAPNVTPHNSPERVIPAEPVRPAASESAPKAAPQSPSSSSNSQQPDRSGHDRDRQGH
jgi:hypothetical protein